MALVVGDLLSDPEAQSFVSLDDADAYLAPEMLPAWEQANTNKREAALITASRWLAYSQPWAVAALSQDDLTRVGHAAARLAVEAISRDLLAPNDPAAAVKSERVGSIAVEYRDSSSLALQWPWLRPMLLGLLGGGSTVPVVRT